MALARRRSAPDLRSRRVDLASRDRVLGRGVAGALAVVVLVVGGIPVAVGWVLGLVPRVGRFAAALGVAALVVSGVLLATSPGLSGGRPGAWADAAAALGVGLLASRLVRLRGRVRRPAEPA